MKPSPRQVCAALLTLSALTAAAGWIARRISAASERGTVDSLMLKFDLAQEDAIGPWISTVLFLVIATLAIDGARRAPTHVRHWQGLAAVALLLSMEQVVHFHQVFFPLARRHLGTAALVGGGLLVVALCLAYVPWLRGLPPRAAKPIGVGGGLVLAAGIGLEALGRRLQGRVDPLLSDLALSLEEGIELVGLSLVIYGLLLLREEPAEP